MAKLLKIMGTIYVICSILLAILYLYNYASMIGTLDVWSIGVGIGIVFQGVFVYCLAACVSVIADKCEDMNYKIDLIDKNTSNGKSFFN